MDHDILNWCLEHQKQRHASGYIILGPPGIGKTTFVGEHPHTWIDADNIFSDLGIHTEDWHLSEHTASEQQLHYEECDRALERMRACGFWVIGSLFWDVKTDAIVLLNKSVHAEYVKQREDLDWTRVEEIVQVLADMAQEKAIPVYDTIDAAVPKPHMKQFVKDKL